MSNYYILDGKRPVQCSDFDQWESWWSDNNRRVASTQVGGVKIATVFTGRDYNCEEDPPLFFETMVLGGKLDGYQVRYSTWDEAEKGHQKIESLVKQDLRILRKNG